MTTQPGLEHDEKVSRYKFIGKGCQLFLLHFAGGSCFSFEFLKKYIYNDISFHALEIPGRGRRLHEKLIKDKPLVIADYVNQIKAKRNGKPYVIYGHSMGATLGLNVTRQMELSGDAPVHLVVSGNPGPGVKKKLPKPRYLLDDIDFKDELRRLGGVPEEVLKDEELFSFFSPIMRADFELLEKDETVPEFKINTPILALMGSEETYSSEISNWLNFTTQPLKEDILSGKHFFIQDHPEKMARYIMNCF
ncbi:thioesterase II family protein [Roseivirga sp. BDSF3-8]|uniref:thioesterase II family protein n=1 Tax=Roseivirga sp. BDSF3-8 TaxID=3241598 RepID=UPI0035327086